VVEQELAGQYEDETSDSPSAKGGPPLGLVGDEEYGRWEDRGGRREWLWHDYLLLHWMLSPSYHYPIYYDSWYGGSGYNTWRSREGYDTGRYAANGSRRARTYGASSIRGAGGRARSRGMGGGGK